MCKIIIPPKKIRVLGKINQSALNYNTVTDILQEISAPGIHLPLQGNISRIQCNIGCSQNHKMTGLSENI